MKVLIFSNYGNWDADAIGFIRAVEVDDLTSASIAPVAAAIAARMTNDEVSHEVARNIKAIDRNRFDELVDELELSVYVDPDFNAMFEAQIEDCVTMVVGVIIA